MPINETPKLLKHKPVRVAIPPDVEPVTADDALTHIKWTADQQTRVTAFLATARTLIEEWCGIAMITQTCAITFDIQGCGPLDDFWYTDNPSSYGKTALYLPRTIELPRPPLLGVASISYVLDDDTDASTTFASTNYYVSAPVPTPDTLPYPGSVTLRRSKTWPTGLRPVDSLTITYTCGYGPAATDVPTPLKEAIIEWAAHMYENREGQQAANAGGAVVLNRGAYMPSGVQAKILPFRQSLV
jgi:hypothetical protein